MNKIATLMVGLLAAAPVFAFEAGQPAGAVDSEVRGRIAGGESLDAIATAAKAAGVSAAVLTTSLILGGADAGAVVTALVSAGMSPAAVVAAAVSAGGSQGAMVTAALRGGADPASITAATAAGGGGDQGAAQRGFGESRASTLGGGGVRSVSPS